MAAHGVKFGDPEIDIDSLRAHKEGVVEKLTGGLAGMARQRGVEVIQGTAAFTGVNELEVSTGDGSRSFSFTNAIIAVGSRSIELPNMPWGDPRLMDSTAALEIRDVPGRLLVVGGGIIGLEMYLRRARQRSYGGGTHARTDAGHGRRPGQAPGAANQKALPGHSPGNTRDRDRRG
jgi:pyruvate/2-oxoglutarate dehydrogenase complex dihydrolipoamide dehydrogenase (E3) component